jgi:hypothetical protein
VIWANRHLRWIVPGTAIAAIAATIAVYAVALAPRGRVPASAIAPTLTRAFRVFRLRPDGQALGTSPLAATVSAAIDREVRRWRLSVLGLNTTLMREVDIRTMGHEPQRAWIVPGLSGACIYWTIAARTHGQSDASGVGVCAPMAVVVQGRLLLVTVRRKIGQSGQLTTLIGLAPDSNPRVVYLTTTRGSRIGLRVVNSVYGWSGTALPVTIHVRNSARKWVSVRLPIPRLLLRAAPSRVPCRTACDRPLHVRRIS